jgi:hypothetical protein
MGPCGKPEEVKKRLAKSRKAAIRKKKAPRRKGTPRQKKEAEHGS